MIDLKHGDCLELMNNIPDKSVDMILCDLPYEVTQNSWDIMIDMSELWTQYERIIKDNGAIILFGQDKFSAKLMLSNEKLHRYNLIWDKMQVSGFLNANKMPLRCHEDILVFYKNQPTYNPQKFIGDKPSHRRTSKNCLEIKEVKTNNCYGEFKNGDFNSDTVETNLKFPISIIQCQKPSPNGLLHPTQKPVELLEYLIKTYTNEGDTVLDNTMGSGSTGIACLNTSRNFIGIELDKQYFEIAKNRIEEREQEIKNSLWR